MTSTTLMTFLLRTSPDVRSVQLLGSWDNFTRPYPMEKDSRVGEGHWRGCHTFTDIVCDGPTNNPSPARSGGLKMGGTYWYYYILDGNIEHYNEAEPVTTKCPLLPGQPVNVLNVPIILPDTRRGHSRESSVSSLKSEHRTMNPEDKYLNPRTPPKPKLPRLKTSPPLCQQANSSWSSLLPSTFDAIHHRSVSQPASATSPQVRIIQKETGKAARSVSPPRSRGFRAALLNLTASHPPGVDSRDHWDRSTARRADGYDCSAPQMARQPDGPRHCIPQSNSSSNYSPRPTPPAGGVAESPASERPPFRRPGLDRKDSGPPPSIQNRRASRSSSRDPSPLRNYLTLNFLSGKSDCSELSNPATTTTTTTTTTRRLETLQEASSQQNSPMLMVNGRTSPTVDDSVTPRPSHVDPRDKRLPTLPNSPSSVMDEVLRALDEQDRELDIEVLRSHFSDYTSTDGSCANSPLERSRFSEWSTDTEMISPASMTSSSTFNNEKQTSPTLGFELDVPPSSKPRSHAPSSGPTTPTIPETLSPTTVADPSPPLHPTAPSIALSQYDRHVSGLGIESLDQVKDNPKRHAAIFDCLDAMKDLALSPTTSRCSTTGVDSEQADGALNTPHATDMTGRRRSSVMQDLVDELSYLGDIIQANPGDGRL